VPRSGVETRDAVTERGIELKNRAEGTVRKAQEVANETAAKVQAAAQELIQRRPGD
ncbi:MAG: YtxH domain-containing protein, partial [Roseiflexaceae bacterium]|nr:YtxH domain-containing protein [Roseiflexaceae bacterium]